MNTTAKKNEKTMEKFSPYLNLATYAVVVANLSYPLGSFNLERELANLTSRKTGSDISNKAPQV